MSNQTSRLTISLIDGVSGAAKGINQSLKGLGMSAADLAKIDKIGAFRNTQKDLIAARQHFAAAQTEVKKLAAEIAASDAPTRRMQQNFKAAQNAVRLSAAEYQTHTAAIKASRAELERAGVPLAKLSAEENRLRSSIAATTAAINNQSKAHRALGAIRGAATSGVSSAALGAAGLITGGKAVSFAKKSITSAAEMDIATRLQRVYTDTPEEVQRRALTPQAKKIGQETPFTNIDVVKAQTAAMQGLPPTIPNEAKAEIAAGMVEHAKYYATLMEVPLKDAAQAVREFLITTGKDISTKEKAITEAQKAVNQIVKMAKIGGMSGEDAQQYLKYASGANSVAGVTPEAMMSMGALARLGGLRGDEAGVFMRTMAAKMVAPGKPGLTALSAAGINYNSYRTMPDSIDPKTLEMLMQTRMGVSFDAATMARVGKLLSDPKVLADQGVFTSKLMEAMEGLTGKGGAVSKAKLGSALGQFYEMSAKSIDTQKLLDDIMANDKLSLAQLNGLLGYRQGGRGAITQRQREQYVAARKQIGEAGDDPEFARKKFDEVAAGLGYAIENLKGSIENLKLSIGEANSGLVKWAADLTGKGLDWISELSPAARQAATYLAAIGALGAGAGGLKLLMDGFGLKGSAVALDGSAAALTAAAVKLGGAGVVGAAGNAAAGAGAGAGAASKGVRLLKALPAIGTAVALLELGNIFEPNLFGGQDNPERKAKASAITDARRKAWNEERARLGLPPLGVPGGVQPGQRFEPQPGGLGNYREVPVRIEDVSQQFGDAGSKAGSAYRETVLAEISKLEQEVQARISSIVGKLSFNASPTITPNIAPTSSPTLNRASSAIRAAHADYGIKDL